MRNAKLPTNLDSDKIHAVTILWTLESRLQRKSINKENGERWTSVGGEGVQCRMPKAQDAPKFLLSRAKNSGDSSVFDELMMMGDSSSSSTKPQSFGISLFGSERSERCQSNNKTFEWTSGREWSWHQLEERKERMTYDEDRSWLVPVDVPTCEFF